MHAVTDCVYRQVAFGTDFSQDQYVQSLIGDKELLFLMNKTMEGMMQSFMNPIRKVRHTIKFQIFECDVLFSSIFRFGIDLTMTLL